MKVRRYGRRIAKPSLLSVTAAPIRIKIKILIFLRLMPGPAPAYCSSPPGRAKMVTRNGALMAGYISYLRSTSDADYMMYDQNVMCIMDAVGQNNKPLTLQLDRPGRANLG
jgi:hypothetical protein